MARSSKPKVKPNQPLIPETVRQYPCQRCTALGRTRLLDAAHAEASYRANRGWVLCGECAYEVWEGTIERELGFLPHRWQPDWAELRRRFPPPPLDNTVPVSDTTPFAVPYPPRLGPGGMEEVRRLWQEAVASGAVLPRCHTIYDEIYEQNAAIRASANENRKKTSPKKPYRESTWRRDNDPGYTQDDSDR